jgi:DNA-binding SARP family transcriptional activator
MHREQAYELLWPGKDDARALNNSLHQALYAGARARRRDADGATILRCATTS